MPQKLKSRFSSLARSIAETHAHFYAQALRAVNLSLTLRNWLVGCCIREYEQRGADRAKYGARLFEELSESLKSDHAIEYHPRELRRCRQFYGVYPQIRGTLSPELRRFLPRGRHRSIRGTASPECAVSADLLIRSLSYSHFVKLLEIEDPLKRAFYEIESIRGQWPVSELERQVDGLLYERTGLSRNKKRLIDFVGKAADPSTPSQAIRDPYVFAFVGLKPREVMHERDLEYALLDKLQEFLLELGRGFCFEARQKRIVIGDGQYFVDLVFYHRILRCHVLIELKQEKFRHEHLGQLNTYLNWYKSHEMSDGDNPPIGLLLCTDKDHALVEYATAGLDNQLFVSRYQLELPTKTELKRFLEQQAKKAETTKAPLSNFASGLGESGSRPARRV